MALVLLAWKRKIFAKILSSAKDILPDVFTFEYFGVWTCTWIFLFVLFESHLQDLKGEMSPLSLHGLLMMQ